MERVENHPFSPSSSTLNISTLPVLHSSYFPFHTPFILHIVSFSSSTFHSFLLPILLLHLPFLHPASPVSFIFLHLSLYPFYPFSSFTSPHFLTSILFPISLYLLSSSSFIFSSSPSFLSFTFFQLYL